MINLIFNEVFRQLFEIVDIMTMPEASIWRSSAEYMFWRDILSFLMFLEKVSILNLNFLITNNCFYFILSDIVIYYLFLNFKGWKGGKLFHDNPLLVELVNTKLILQKSYFSKLMIVLCLFYLISLQTTLQLQILSIVKTLENVNCFSFHFNLQEDSCLLSYFILLTFNNNVEKQVLFIIVLNVSSVSQILMSNVWCRNFH